MTSQKKPFLFWLMLITLIFVGLFAFATSLLSTAQAGVSAVPGGGVPDISLELFATGLSEPVSLANAGDSRLFVVEQEGIIRIVGPDGTVVGTPFLDITDRVEYGVGSEQGLLGLAFDPNFASNGYFYVNYTYCTISDCPDYGAETNLYTRISRFSVSADPNLANPASELVLISIQQPYGEHNGGDINFGPDGYLYIGMGDGGNADDPENHAQYGGDLLGKMLRIDVDGGGLPPDCEPTGNYTVPANNPFVGMADTCNEIWQMGTRNPWRFSFDQLTGDLYIADVGENGWEEVNFQPAGDSGGQNWGWRCYQGTHPHISDGCGPDADYDFPFFEYEQTTLRCAVIGGYVYRGGRYPVLFGHYLFVDYCKGDFWTAINDNGTWTVTLQGDLGGHFFSFGEGADGEIYISANNGNIYHIVENTISQTPTPSPTPTQPVNITPVATGFLEPLDVENAGDDRLFVAERGGMVYEVAGDGTRNPTPYLDISDRVLTDFWQQGLLSIAFHPNFSQNGYLYAQYTDLNGDVIVSRFTYSGTVGLASTQGITSTVDPATEFNVLTVPHPNTSDENNGGELAFGTDGYLYISIGDGGVHDNAQDLQSLLGKVLRIDVDGGLPYAIPPDNPFVGVSGAREEIWAYGLRNPWRFSLDSLNGQAYIGDVGESQKEELDVILANSTGGENFGWSCYEGSSQGAGYDPGACTDTYQSPRFEYDHTVGNVIVGGYVYRGCQYLDMRNHYFFADFGAGKLWRMPIYGQDDPLLLTITPQQISSFGQGVDGELYFLGYDLGTPTGVLYHLAGNVNGLCLDLPYSIWVPLIFNP